MLLLAAELLRLCQCYFPNLVLCEDLPDNENVVGANECMSVTPFDLAAKAPLCSFAVHLEMIEATSEQVFAVNQDFALVFERPFLRSCVRLLPALLLWREQTFR